MRILLLAGVLAMNLAFAAWPSRAATLDVSAYTRDATIGEIKLSPDGRFYAATVPGEGRSVLMMVRRVDNEAIAMFSLGKNTGYALIRGPWRPFAVKLNGSIRLNRGELMKWAATNQGKVA